MIIFHHLDDFLFELFPKSDKARNDFELLTKDLTKFYTVGPYKPKVIIKNNIVEVHIEEELIGKHDGKFQEVVKLCEIGNYDRAKEKLFNLIDEAPNVSEYHRILGQIYSDQGNQEEAINNLIDALRWDPKNGWALIMMGNILAKHKNDIPTAMKYYDKAIEANPDDNIAVYNIGANLMQHGKKEEAKKYFEKAKKLNPEYPNTYYAFSLIAEMEDNLFSAFTSAGEAIKKNKKRDDLYLNSERQLFSIANKVIKSGIGKKIVKEYLSKLEILGDREIELIVDSEIPTAAKLELAENYNRQNHFVRFKQNYPAVEHLQMHELVHLDLMIEARKEKLNQLFVSTQVQKAAFIKGLDVAIKKLKKLGISDESISEYCSSLFDGLNLQVYNTPIDLFIEDFLYNEFPDLRPYQFVSMYALLQEGIKATTDKKIVELSPKDVLSKSKTYNIVNALQFRDLFGIDLISSFNARPLELNQAQEFFYEYKDYKDDRKPGEEYELVLHWAEDLKLDKNFDLVDEETYYSKTTNLDNILESIEKDPFDIETKDPIKEGETVTFQKSQKEIGTNMAVVMYMVGALEYFQNVSKENTKKIALEIAMLGAQGISPDKEGYRLSSISGKKFSGYHLLAYYYVSWKLAIPEMVSQLNLPYDKEYEMAKSSFEAKKK